MRPIRSPVTLTALLALAAPAFAQAPQAASTTASATTGALPPAATLVPAAPSKDRPVVPVVERMLNDDELLAASADVPDDPAVADEIDSESADLEDLRRAEEESHVQDRGPGVPH